MSKPCQNKLNLNAIAKRAPTHLRKELLTSYRWTFVLLYDSLLDVLHLRSIAGLGIGLLVGVADGEDVVQFVVGRDVKTVEEKLAFLVRQQEAHRTAKATCT